VELLARLKDAFPVQFAGIKDSSHDETFAADMGKRFGADLAVFSGTDSHFHHALKHHAQGAITAPANLLSQGLRTIWDLYQQGKDPSDAQARVIAQRHVLETYMPFPPSLKALLHKLHDLPRWTVKPPLDEIEENSLKKAVQAFSSVYSPT
jgi:dihydrodipicolinate synthase/N-acetylneuraminate lyase